MSLMLFWYGANQSCWARHRPGFNIMLELPTPVELFSFWTKLKRDQAARCVFRFIGQLLVGVLSGSVNMRSAGFRQKHFMPLFVVTLIFYLGTAEQVPAQSRTTFPMPNVIGLSVSEAKERVLSAGRNSRATSVRVIEVGRRSDARPAGQIIQQVELPGTPMRPYLDDVGGKYGEVTFSVFVSSGPELAPNLVGRTLEAAEQVAMQGKLALSVGASQSNPRIPKGIVARQEPVAGQPMPRRRITVYPSAGYPLPNYVRRPLEDARRDARKLAFRLEEESENRVDVPSGVIFEQDPGVGALLPLRGPVRVKVSRGWPVPDFIGQLESNAREIAAENRIRLNRTAQDNYEVPPGVIFSQQPPAGGLLPRDQTVNITVSLGFPLPDLVGMQENQVRRLASELKFSLDTRHVPLPHRRVGHIDRQNPEPGTRLPFDMPVSIIVSEGWPTPDFLTLEEDEARSLASEKQVILRIVEHRQDRETRPGVVIDQTPRPGTLLAPGQAVGIVVSASKPTPRLVGLTKIEATTLAESEDIILDATEKPSRELSAGLVSEQFPKPGAPLPADGKVSVIISAGWPTPDFIGKSEEEANNIATDNKVTLVKIAPREHFEFSAGLVIEQQPAANTLIPANRRVAISLSLGWPVAPAAVGLPAGTARQEFVAQYPNAIVDQSESLLTFEPVGTVISQHPAPNVKLGPGQRLSLVSSAEKPPWLWPVIGVVLTMVALGAYAWLKPAPDSPTTRELTRTEDPGGVRLQVTKDHGVQTTDKQDKGDTNDTATGDTVRISVTVDLGEQSAGPIDDKGDET